MEITLERELGQRFESEPLAEHPRQGEERLDAEVDGLHERRTTLEQLFVRVSRVGLHGEHVVDDRPARLLELGERQAQEVEQANPVATRVDVLIRSRRLDGSVAQHAAQPE